MNIDRLTTIAEWLEAGAPHRDGVDGFDMSAFIRRDAPCGTTCCIAGAAVAFFGEPAFLMTAGDIDESAEHLLGLSNSQSEGLFYAVDDFGQLDLDSIDPAWAARCIRKLIATGEVDWEGTRDE